MADEDVVEDDDENDEDEEGDDVDDVKIKMMETRIDGGDGLQSIYQLDK